jgi:predicted MFS family arabinose efflux permease
MVDAFGRGEPGKNMTSRATRGAVPGLATVIGLSLTANQMTAVALPWLVLERTGRAFDAGLLAFCTGAALVLGGWVGGVLADRVGAGRIAFVSDLLGALVNAAIPLLAIFDLLSFPALVLLAALGAMLDPAGVTARESLLPEAARAGGVRLEKANAWSEGAQGLAYIVGPAMGGLLIAGLGASSVLLITAGLFLCTALGGGIIARRIAPGARTGGSASWFAGWDVLRGDRLLWAITLIGTVWMAALAPITGILLPVLFHGTGAAEQLGWLLAAMGAGGVAGAWVYGGLPPRIGSRRILLLGLLCEVTGLVLLGLARESILQIGAAGLTGFAGGAIMPLINTVFQRRAPAGALGRVLGTSTSLAMAAAPVGFLAAGWLAGLIGPRPTILVCSAVLLATFLYAVRARPLRELDENRSS